MPDITPLLTPEVVRALTDLLCPVLPVSPTDREVLIFRTLGTHPLLNDLNYSGTRNSFAGELIQKLARFGDSTPGVPALCALLEQVRGEIGVDRQIIANDLHARIKEIYHPAPPKAAPSLPGLPLVFIAHAHSDQRIAREVCEVLEEGGDVRAWLAPRDIPASADWPAAITYALEKADVFLLIHSEAAQSSVNVYRELVFVNNRKPLPPCFTLRTDSTPVQSRFAFYLNTTQWMDAANEGVLNRLREAVRQCREKMAASPDTAKGQPKTAEVPGILPPKQILPSTKKNSLDNAEMILIPAGDFLMGISGSQANPQRIVTLNNYYIYKTPVTVAQYREFCRKSRNRHRLPDPPPWGWHDDHPMVNVTWEAARAYCRWAGGDLPTEAQWEKAARGTEGRKYPWGNVFDSSRLQCSKSKYGDAEGTAAVDGFPDGASPYGVTGMAGNVWQWCLDYYDKTYPASAPNRNPAGPDAGTLRVVRGGSWYYDNEYDFRSTLRRCMLPDHKNGTVGFRVVLPAP